MIVILRGRWWDGLNLGNKKPSTFNSFPPKNHVQKTAEHTFSPHFFSFFKNHIFNLNSGKTLLAVVFFFWVSLTGWCCATSQKSPHQPTADNPDAKASFQSCPSWRASVGGGKVVDLGDVFSLPTPKVERFAPEKLPKPNRKGYRLPSIIFQGRAVKIGGVTNIFFGFSNFTLVRFVGTWSRLFF